MIAIIPEPCKRAGRAVAAGEPLGVRRERKVRTLQGSEPANGWASGAGMGGLWVERLVSMTTSATENRPASGS